MRAFWNTVEKLDKATFSALDKLNAVRNKPTFRAQVEAEMKDIREPQKAITFDA